MSDKEAGVVVDPKVDAKLDALLGGRRVVVEIETPVREFVAQPQAIPGVRGEKREAIIVDEFVEAARPNVVVDPKLYSFSKGELVEEAMPKYAIDWDGPTIVGAPGSFDRGEPPSPEAGDAALAALQSAAGAVNVLPKAVVVELGNGSVMEGVPISGRVIRGSSFDAAVIAAAPDGNLVEVVDDLIPAPEAGLCTLCKPPCPPALPGRAMCEKCYRDYCRMMQWPEFRSIE